MDFSKIKAKKLRVAFDEYKFRLKHYKPNIVGETEVQVRILQKSVLYLKTHQR